MGVEMSKKLAAKQNYLFSKKDVPIGLFLPETDVDKNLGRDASMRVVALQGLLKRVMTSSAAKSGSPGGFFIPGPPFIDADEVIDVKRDFYYRVDENTRSLTLNRGDCSVSLIPIGPTPGRVRESLRAAIADQSVKRSVNAISLVLVLRVESDGRYFNMLLGGDADKEGLERAFEVWSSRTETAPDGSSLSAVKLAHHGSMGSHSTRVCNARARNGAGVAAISVGTRYRVPPDREVMREYLDNGWTVLLTTKRVATRRRQFAIEVAGRPSARREDVQRHDLRITWSPRPEWIGSPKTRRSRHRNSDFMDPRRAAPERTAEARSSKRQVNALRC